MNLTAQPHAAPDRAAIVAHYTRVGPLLEATLGPIPLVIAMHPDGAETPARYRFALDEPPASIATVTVRGKPYLAATAHGIAWATHRYRATSFGSWTPTVADPEAVRFARLTLAPGTHGGDLAVALACLALRAALEARGLQALLLLDGAGGAALWIPLAGAPLYDAARAFLHELVNAAALAHPTIFTGDRLRAQHADLVHVNVATNAVDHFSALPYTLRDDASHAIVTPLRWDELGRGSACTAPELEARLAAAGDVFASGVAAIGEQRLPRVGATFAAAREVVSDEHGHVLAAIRTILTDGRARTIDAICAEAIAAGLVAATTIPNYIRNSITTLLDRERNRGEEPEFVVLDDGRVRANVPLDLFASFAQPAAPNAAAEALAARLAASSVRDAAPRPDDGPDIGAPFERDVAAAFAFLGMRSERRGGQGEPDVVALAPLGDDAYTVVVECKTASREAQQEHRVTDTFADEAATMRDRVHGDYAVLLGPEFAKHEQLDDELRVHRVALWTVADLVALVRAHAAAPIPWPDLLPLFAPGRASARIAAFVFAHAHGARQRATVAYRAVLEEGLRYQDSLAAASPDVERAGSPLTVEALTVLVNLRLTAAGDLGRVSVDDVRGAVAYGTHPAVGTLLLAGTRVVVTVRAQAQTAAVTPAPHAADDDVHTGSSEAR